MKIFIQRIIVILVLLTALPCATYAESANGFNEQGVRAFDSRDWNSAIYYFSQALTDAPDNATVQRNLSNAYQGQAVEYADQGDVQKSNASLKHAIEVDPTNPIPFVQMGANYLTQGLVSDAIFRLEEAIEIAPKNVNAHFLLGEAYYRDSDAPSALEQWEWVYEKDPDLKGLRERIEMARREKRVEGNFEGLTSKHFHVTHHPAVSKRDVRALLKILEDAYLQVGRSMGRVYPPSPIQVTLYNAEGFSETTQLGDHIAAVFDGTKIRLPVISAEGDLLRSEALKPVLIHEYVHVVVHQIAGNTVPWWLNEGLAEALSSGEIDTDRRSVLRFAKDNNQLFALADLTEHQLDKLSPDDLQIAYSQSHATVNYLKQHYGVLKIASLLRRIADGQSPEVALRISCRVSYKTLELAVNSRIDKG